MSFAPLPEPPYYAVIFANQLRNSTPGYTEMAEKMAALAETMPGYLGLETTRDAQGFGITVSYWRDEDAIHNWRTQADHMVAQNLGRTRWYTHFKLRIAKVERQYERP